MKAKVMNCNCNWSAFISAHSVLSNALRSWYPTTAETGREIVVICSTDITWQKFPKLPQHCCWSLLMPPWSMLFSFNVSLNVIGWFLTYSQLLSVHTRGRTNSDLFVVNAKVIIRHHWRIDDVIWKLALHATVGFQPPNTSSHDLPYT